MKKKGSRLGICPKCFNKDYLDRHHVLMKAWFGRGPENNDVLYLCRTCHDAFHRDKVLGVNPKSKKECYRITEKWLKEDYKPRRKR